MLKDEIIRLAGLETWEKYPLPLRRIVVWDDKNKTEIVLLTDHLKCGSTTISSIDRERWQIAVFFKTSAAEPQGQNLYWGELERSSHPDLDSSCSSTGDQVAALWVKGWLVVLKYGPPTGGLRLNLFTYRDLDER